MPDLLELLSGAEKPPPAKKSLKRFLGISVLEAAQQRISWAFDSFEKICVSFSGGKDSAVMLHLVMDEAIKRGQKIHVLFIDWEAQYELTIAHVRDCFELYKEHIIPYWVCLPLTTTNAVSVYEPEWVCWDPAKKDLWVREMPEGVISDPAVFPFYEHKMTFEEFVPAFGEWFGSEVRSAACLIGIRSGESLNRFRTLINTRKVKKDGHGWTTRVADPGTFNVYPIYDWHTKDIWTYFGKFNKVYNRLYDRFHQAGLTLHQMRICEPYGDEQRKGLWLFHVIEPQTWGKILARVAGANSGALYAGERGNILGNQQVTLPEGHTWKSFTMMLLDTMPQTTAEHYRNKFAVYLKWYKDNEGLDDVPDSVPGDTGSKDVGSWRRLARCLLKNDFWCASLSFGYQKNSAYKKYQALMKRRRKEWGIFQETVTDDQ